MHDTLLMYVKCQVMFSKPLKDVTLIIEMI